MEARKNQTLSFFKIDDEHKSFFIAVEEGDLAKIEKAFSFIQDINCKNKEEDTALHIAAKRGFLEIAKFLIENGADINAVNSKQCNSVDIPPILGCNENQKISDEGSQGKKQQEESKKEAQNKEEIGRTPLYFAIINNQYEMAKFLLDKGANTEIKNVDGYTSLHATLFNPEMTSLLLKYKRVNINAMDNEGYTFLGHAIQYNKIEIIKMLLGAGVAVNDPFKGLERGLTPLHYAIRRDNAEAVQLLLEYDADTSIKDPKGKTPIQYTSFNTFDDYLASKRSWWKVCSIV